VLVRLSGPPGGVVTVVVASVRAPGGDLAAMLGTGLNTTIQVVAPDRASIAGDTREGLTFHSGAGMGRIGWFGCVMTRPGGSVVVAIGVSARSSNPITAADIASNPAIAAALATLEIV
jgi:hypothetical protein